MSDQIAAAVPETPQIVPVIDPVVTPSTPIDPVNETTQNAQTIGTEETKSQEKHSVLTEIETFLNAKLAQLRSLF